LQLQFDKTELSSLQQVKWEVQNQEQTQEVRLEDTLPDIGRVLGAWGQVLLRGKEWHSGRVHISGGVMVWVLYAPEDGDGVRKIASWIPFQMKWEIPQTEHDGTMQVCCLLRGVDARSISARKIMVRTNVGVQLQAMVPATATVYTPQQLPQDVQILRNTYPLCLPKEMGEKPFYIDETFPLPADCPSIENVVCYSLRPVLQDKNVMADKVVFRGTAFAHLMYLDSQGQIRCWDGEFPFSQYAELDNTYAQEVQAVIVPAVTSLELDTEENGQLHLKAGLTGQYTVYERHLVEVAEDAYSTQREVTLQTDTLQLPVVLEMQSQSVYAQMQPQSEETVIDAVFYPEHIRPIRTEQGVELEMNGQFQTLSCDAAGELNGGVTKWSDSIQLPAADNTAVLASVTLRSAPHAGAGNTLRAELQADAYTMAQQGISMVTGLEIGEAAAKKEERPSLILRPAGEDSLWQIAKATGSTVEAIEKANALTQPPEPDRFLLIPVL